jgi:PAS domain S-box-containing protein
MAVELEQLFGAGAPVLARAFDQFPDGVAAFTAEYEDGKLVDFVCRYVNPATAAISGVPVERLTGARMLDVVPTFREAGVFEGYRRALEDGVPWDFELDFAGDVADTHVDARLEMRAVRLGEGLLVTYRDVTALRRGEDALERMAAIVRSTDDAIVSADRAGRITHWNPGAERLLGYPAAEIVGRPVTLLVRADELPEQQARFEAALAGNRVDRIETQWVRRDRTLVDVRLTASPLRDREGRVIGVTAVVHDITRSRRTEAELRRSNAELERFAALAAHDLRTPAITLVHLSRLLAAASEEPGDLAKVRQIGGLVEAAAAHARRLVDGLAEYARSTRAETAPRLVDLGDLAADVVTALQPEIEEAGARVEVGALPSVIGDGGGLSRVLQNLVANALKYRADAPPLIAVGAERDDAAWVIAVADNGRGIGERDRRRIFDLFARANGGEEDVDGHGIGLAVCQTIVEHHGGRIWVDPAPGGGSVFRFTLPERLLLEA